MGKKRTPEEYVAEVARVNQNIEVVGEYIDAKTKILHRCKMDGHEWYPQPASVLQGHGCPKCYFRRSAISRMKTHEEYADELYEVNQNIRPIEQYMGNDIKIKHLCLIDGNVWEVSPHMILLGTGCPKCALRSKTMSHEEYVCRLHDTSPHIVVIGRYVNSDTKILHRCFIDGNEWYARPHQMLNGSNCPVCDRRNRTKTHDQYVKEVAIFNQNIEVLGTYINNKTEIKCRCKIDGYIWTPRADSILFDTGCPVCNMSHGEKEISNYLVHHNIAFIAQYTFDNCKNKFCLPFDFYLPKYHTCIEYDGEQHFRPVDFWGGEEGFRKRNVNDSIKNNFCAVNNITLLRIKYDQDVNAALDSFFNSLTIQN